MVSVVLSVYVFILWIPFSASVTVAGVTCTYCNTGCFDIAPLEEWLSSMKGSRANLASVDKLLDMMRTHRVMTVLANHCNCCCCCYPMAAHVSVSFSLEIYLSGAAGCNGISYIRGTWFEGQDS
jgi:hypothetical protein